MAAKREAEGSKPASLNKRARKAKLKDATRVKVVTSAMARKAFGERMRQDWFKPANTPGCAIRASFLGYDKSSKRKALECHMREDAR